MAYSKNPHLAKVRMEAVRLVKWRGWSTRQAARYTGFAQGTIVKWCQRVFAVVLPLQNWFYGIILAQFLKYSLILSLKSVGTSVIEIARVNPVLNQVVLEKVDCRCSVGTDS